MADYLDSLKFVSPSGEAIDRSPAAVFRQKCRNGSFTGITSGHCLSFVQANVVILPYQHAYDFLLFCQRNPKPCPLLEVMDTGSYEASILAPGSDLRSDVPLYRIVREGRNEEERTDIRDLWTGDMVCFLLGCSFAFEGALLEAGLGVRHIEEGKNVPMYITNIPCRPAGVFSGNLVVSMRPYPEAMVPEVKAITARFPKVHGAPVHSGDPAAIGIRDLGTVDFGDSVEVKPGEVPVFWACGVTPLVALRNAKLPLAITHSPGHMFVTDGLNSELAI